ncbi:MAG: hypothetical protein HW381_1990 [Candidatus Rokubacteria bacterium]|nr:hypothetical protein [Candidatus Rokubacteria bacterium]
MTTDYDPIAEQYKRSKLQPWRTHVESLLVFGAVAAVGLVLLLATVLTAP